MVAGNALPQLIAVIDQVTDPSANVNQHNC